MWYLFLCFLLPNNEYQPIMRLNDEPYMAYRDCDNISNHSMVHDTYQEEFPDKTLVYQCIKITKRK